MRILYAVGSWGLGHATRGLPLIAGLLDAGATLTVVSTGRALLLLRAGTKTAEAGAAQRGAHHSWLMAAG